MTDRETIARQIEAADADDELLKRYPGIVREETRKVNLEIAAYKRASKGRCRPLSRQPFERIRP